jgi:K(+)-stimulated pyrophosphate-energized sodium pump
MVSQEISKEVQVIMSTNEDGSTKAVVTTTTTENGTASTEEKVFEGTAEEVKAEIQNLKDVKVEVKTTAEE